MACCTNIIWPVPAFSRKRWMPHNNEINTVCVILILMNAVIKLLVNSALIFFFFFFRNIKRQRWKYLYTKHDKQKYYFWHIYQVDVNVIFIQQKGTIKICSLHVKSQTSQKFCICAVNHTLFQIVFFFYFM